MTNPDYTHISVLVDRSGSMAMIQADAEGGLRTFMDEQFALPGKLTTSLFQFDDVFDTVFRMESSSAPAKNWSLQPRGVTALLDGIGKSVALTGEDLTALPEDQRPGKVLFVIVTDGLENASRDWTREKVFDLITRQREDYSWEFLFLAANQDAIAAGRDIGIQFATNYQATGDGTQAVYAAASASAARYRSSGAMSAPERV